ncbi:MAG: hypothetical protein KC416_11745 [Myxococcales bacterium]|nr:hypothetical protein [Myxococcales bacterium]
MPLDRLGADPMARLDEEARWFVRLAARGVPVVPGVRVSMSGEDAPGRLLAAVRHLFDTAPEGHVVRVRAMPPSRLLESRFSRQPGAIQIIQSPAEVAVGVDAFIAAVRVTDLTAALGGSLDRLHVLASIFEPERAGSAASADPVQGDPEQVVVWVDRSAPWHVDRRTARVTQEGEGGLESRDASTVADLADRAQLTIRRPVEIDWARAGGRYCISGIRHLHLVPGFTQSPYRILTLVAPDEGTVAPMAVDALDRALSRDDEPSDEPRVRRLYARPYRRQDWTDRHGRVVSDTVSISRLALRAAEVAKDVASPLAAVTVFERGLSERLAMLDAQDLRSLDVQTLLAALWDRQRLAVEAFILLDRHRVATIAVLTALEMAGGALPREKFPAIARPRHTKKRRRLHERLRRLADSITAEHGDLVPYGELSPALKRRWEELRASLADVRPLGIDICADAIGASDETMLSALRVAMRIDEEGLRRARRGEVRRVLGNARSKPLGRSREALASSLILLQSRVSHSKGVAVEGLAAALLRVRRAACEVGRRLVEDCILDEPEDALYFYLPEIEQAVAGEPGAYASRVRLRREDDERWAEYEAPRRIESRRPHG